MLFSPKKNNNYTCKYIAGGLIFSQNGNIIVCGRAADDNDSEFTFMNNFNGLNFDSASLKQFIINLRSKYNNNLPLGCNNCENTVHIKQNNEPVFDFIELNHWKSCFLNCVYCNYEKVDDLSLTSHYDITPVIQELIDPKLISKNTKIIFKCGDALLHPEFDKLMYFFINFGMKDIEIHTSGQRYCHSVSEAIDKKIAKIFISFDGGCPYIYEKVKGYNKFDIAMSTLKRYFEYDDKNKKRVIISYTLVKGINDNKKEILDWFIMSRGLGIKKLFVDIDVNWYNSVNGIPDNNLSELLLFIKELSSLNNFDIDFSLKTLKMYNEIVKGHNVYI